MNKLQKQIIRAFADADMSVAGASRATHRHRNTIEYHLAQVQEITGLDPKNFHDLVKLYGVATAEEATNG